MVKVGEVLERRELREKSMGVNETAYTNVFSHMC